MPPPAPPAHRAFTYSAPFSAQSYDWLGLDLDHCVARYAPRALARLVYACVARGLGELFPARYPRAVFEQVLGASGSAAADAASADALDGEPAWVAAFAPPLEASRHVLQKGLVFDFDFGDLLKLDCDGRVAAAWHGLRPLPVATRDARYGPGPWRSFELLRHQQRVPHAFVMLTGFDVPAQLSLCQSVAHIDAQQEQQPPLAASGAAAKAMPAPLPLPSPYSHLQSDHVAVFDHIFDNVAAFDSRRGGYFASIVASPSTYVLPRPRLAAALAAARRGAGAGTAGALRHRPQRVFLVTNSHAQYARLVLRASLGAAWRACFDLVVLDARKGAFFSAVSPRAFRNLDTMGREDGALAARLVVGMPAVGALYSGGGAAALQAIADADVALRGGPFEGRPLAARLSGDGARVEGVFALAADATADVNAADADADAGARAAVAAALGAPRARILYAGDHLHGDVASAGEAGWDAAAVLEEAEADGPGAGVATAAHSHNDAPGSGAVATASTSAARAWGSFFSASDGHFAEGASKGGDDSSAAAAPRRAWFCALAAQAAAVVVSDVEALFPNPVEDVGEGGLTGGGSESVAVAASAPARDGAGAAALLHGRAVAVSFTGGKDCVLALHRCRAAGAEVAVLATFVPPRPAFLAHPLPVIAATARSLGLPWVALTVDGGSDGTGFEAGYRAAIVRLRAEWGVEFLVTGDILDVADGFLPSAARGSGVTVARPLFGGDAGALLDELAAAGFAAVVSLVSVPLCGTALAEQLLGARLADVRAPLGALGQALAVRGLHSCGEGGEFHTWVVSGPGLSTDLDLSGAERCTTADGAFLYLALEVDS